MANLPETPQWEDGIYQIEVSDPVLGGPDGISNRQGKQLASRTLYLKQQVEKGGSDLAKHIAAADPHTQYAPKASPTFTGTPTAPTPENSDNSKKLATTEFVAKALAALAGSAPETLDTLKELADALGNDPNFATTVLNKLAEKLAKDQNGADIPDPALFVKNLGLGELSIAGVSGGSLTASGYITIPMIINGARRALYIQWGGFSGTTSSSGSNGIYEVSNITVTWPVAFPNAVFQVITGGSSDVGGAGQQEMAWSLGNTKTSGNFGFQCRTPNASMTGSYFVIGY
ncbi:gp53-like domain-containing protein [Cronobacter sakazakii]|uniref:gp53-like domain-containing protein n=1 Tax=Cronobacter sakazakii TaxID=28141 RepID=UPI0021C2890B|nr:phage tail protein [Cronobacter sakazakii]